MCTPGPGCCVGGSGLRGGYAGYLRASDVLNLLLVSVQDDNHGAAGPDDEHRKQNLREQD